MSVSFPTTSQNMDITARLIAAVKAFALANYDKGEWSLIAEVYTDQEIGDLIVGAENEKSAVTMVRRYLSPVVGVIGYADAGSSAQRLPI